MNLAKYAGPLALDPVGPPSLLRGFLTVESWLIGDLFGFAVARHTSSADICAALFMYPELLESLKENPGPYTQPIAVIASIQARDAIDALFL